MIGGPPVPRASKLRTTPPPEASGCEEANASAPQRQASSASVSTTTTSLRGRGPLARARTDSSSADTPAPSSAAPGPFCTESWCAIRNTRPVGSVPGRTATTLRTRAISASPGPVPQVPTACCTRVSSPRPVRVATSESTTRSSAALPATCVCAAIACTCSNARAALNSVAGASAGAGAGGCSATTLHTTRPSSRTSRTRPAVRPGRRLPGTSDGSAGTRPPGYAGEGRRHPRGSPAAPAQARSVEGLQPVGEQLRSCVAALLGVELGRRQGPVLDPGDESLPVLGPGDQGLGEWTGWSLVTEREVAHTVGMDEVETLVGQILEQHAARRHVDGVPAHVREHGGLQPLDDARPLPASLRIVAVLHAAVEEDLHADADAQDGTATGQPAADDPRPVDGAQARHAGGEGTDPGDDQPVGVQGGIAVGGDRDVGADPGQRTLGRAQIARPVVEHRHLLHASHGSHQPPEASPCSHGSTVSSLLCGSLTPCGGCPMRWPAARPAGGPPRWRPAARCGPSRRSRTARCSRRHRGGSRPRRAGPVRSSPDYSAPLVDGTSVTRGSSATAVRSARASALNWPSTMWWASRPP